VCTEHVALYGSLSTLLEYLLQVNGSKTLICALSALTNDGDGSCRRWRGRRESSCSRQRLKGSDARTVGAQSAYSEMVSMLLRGGFSLSAALLLAFFSLGCIYLSAPRLHRTDGPTELEAARSTSITAAAISSKVRSGSALPQRVQSLAMQSKPPRTAAVVKEPEISSVARMTQLASEGDLSPTTQNEIDIIENNMNFLRDQMDKVSDQLSAEHDFMQVCVNRK
jgi:hypothetical protein